MREEPLPYPVWGADLIGAGARQQMDNAMRLPVTVAGALMPDAHAGYGLPIGGVLATHEAVIPYAVGVDIACRMRLSVFDASAIVLNQQRGHFDKVLRATTRFGAGVEWKPVQDDAVMEDPDWTANPLLRGLKDKASRQLGTSGSGNHFVELGEIDVDDEAAAAGTGFRKGKHLALLSHSGSRGTGARIAEHYSQIARDMHPELQDGSGELPRLGWLDIKSQAGQEYWLSMNLAGRYASANHQVIHRNIARAIGLEAVAVVENQHNFCWEEQLPNGQTVYIHRKGATPAGAGALGVIPGTMADIGYVVRGRGNADSLNSAAHGAGRQMSRLKALAVFTKSMRDGYLQLHGVTLLGGGMDEAPQAYKYIKDVMAAQSDLVEVIARFRPRIVMMTDDPRDA
ncbi:MAG: RtcB family protein [Thermoflexales bacterium]